MKIAVVGYGIGGIAAAISLRQLGHDVIHFEQAPQPGFIGAGLLLQPPAIVALEKLGLAVAASALGTKIFKIIGADKADRQIIHLDYTKASPTSFGLGIQRGALFEILRDADTRYSSLRSSCQISGVDAETGYLVESNGRRSGPFDLIVGADGSNSVVRRSVSHLVRRDRNCNYGAVVFLVDNSDTTQSSVVHQHFSGGQHISFWPVGRSDAVATPRINVSINISASKDTTCFDGQWRAELAQRFPKAVKVLTSAAKIDKPIFTTYRDVELARFYSGCVVLIGDAAHAMSPQLGQGASMALLDAIALADSLKNNNDVSTALAKYDHERRQHVKIYQKISRLMTPLFQSDHASWVWTRDNIFPPLSRLPLFERAMLRTLCGQQNGWLNLNQPMKSA